MVGPMERTTTPDDVYQVLRTAILDGNLSAGEQLREAHIATQLGISRASVREALTRLEEDGLVLKIPFRGAFVIEVTDRDIAEIASIRSLVESFALELSMDSLRGAHRAEMLRAVEDLRDAARRGDIPASIEAHLSFHRLMYQLSGHRLLQDMWKGWESKLRLYLAADHRSYGDLDEIAVKHERLALAVIRGDQEAIKAEMA